MIHTHPGISRAEIAQESGLSKAAISTTVTDLLDRGVLIEGQTSPASAGRRRVGLQVNQEFGLALGIEIASGHCTAMLTDLSGQSLQSSSHTFEALAINDIVRQAAALVKSIAPLDKPLVGIGVSIHGVVDSAGETALLFDPKTWAGEVPLATLLREQLDVEIDTPIALVNTYHAGALAEHRSGAGQDTDDMIFVSVGDAIGAGLVLAGELYCGSSGGAGELGHLAIDPDGPACQCGSIGCLEALAGGPAVIERAVKELKEQERDHLLTRSGPVVAPFTLRDVIEAAVAGDLAALSAVRQAGEYLGLAIAGLVNTLNPRRVVVGGELAETGDTLIAPLRQAVLRRALPAAYSTVEVVPAALGRNAPAIGAAALAIDRYLLAFE